MSHSRVHADHQVQIGDQRGGVGKVVQLLSPVDQLHSAGGMLCLRCRLALLQTVEIHTRHLSQRSQNGQRDGSVVVILVR